MGMNHLLMGTANLYVLLTSNIAERDPSDPLDSFTKKAQFEPGFSERLKMMLAGHIGPDSNVTSHMVHHYFAVTIRVAQQILIK